MQPDSYRSSIIVSLLFVYLCSSAVIFSEKPSWLAAVLAPYRNAESRLTIVARADGTFDIKEFPQRDRWFAPEVVGAGLAITGKRRFGRAVKPSSVDVLVKADAGASDEAVRVALSSARASGFTRFGFVDPRLGEVVNGSHLPASRRAAGSGKNPSKIGRKSRVRSDAPQRFDGAIPFAGARLPEEESLVYRSQA